MSDDKRPTPTDGPLVADLRSRPNVAGLARSSLGRFWAVFTTNMSVVAA
jgi:hypothetical protein